MGVRVSSSFPEKQETIFKTLIQKFLTACREIRQKHI